MSWRVKRPRTDAFHPPVARGGRRAGQEAAAWKAVWTSASTPAPPRSDALAAFTMASTRCCVMSPRTTSISVTPRLYPVPSSDVAWDGDDYQARFDRLAAAGADVHGEATFVRAYAPASVLDAGCGTGRVGIELARHGIEVLGADVDGSMLATARRLAPEIRWVEADLTALDLGRTFDVVVLAGNVPLFTPPGTQASLVAGVARHVAPDGVLIAGFILDRGYGVDDYDAHAADAGLVLAERFATWDRAEWTGGHYAVSVHRRREIGSPAGGWRGAHVSVPPTSRDAADRGWPRPGRSSAGLGTVCTA
jgi:SAM-dependent methyltransferase